MGTTNKTYLQLACEKIALENPHFRQFHIGTSFAYGFPMSVLDKENLCSYFTIMPDIDSMNFNFLGAGSTQRFKDMEEQECYDVIKEAMNKAEDVLLMERFCIIKNVDGNPVL